MSDPYADQRDLVASVLKRIQTEGDNISENVAILIFDDERNYYIQLAAGHDETPDGRDPLSLYAEAVGNEVLPTSSQLSEDQQSKLLALGWKPPRHSPNYYRSWISKSDSDRMSISEQILNTMQQVYGFNINGEIHLELMIAL